MRVRFVGIAAKTASTHEAKYVSTAQTFLSTGREYEVHAVSVYDGVLFLLIVDDKQTPTFAPRSLFETVDAGVPPDWICNAFPEGLVQLVLGPDFIAGSLAAYEGMIDQRMPQVDAFWARLDSRESE